MKILNYIWTGEYTETITFYENTKQQYITEHNSQSTLSEFNEWYSPNDEFDCKVVLWGCDHKVFRPPNQDDEEEQLDHEKIRSRYDCDDEFALNYMAETKTPMILAVGRLVARKGYMTLLRAMPEILQYSATPTRIYNTALEIINNHIHITHYR